jgi:hypothetical protein
MSDLFEQPPREPSPKADIAPEWPVPRADLHEIARDAAIQALGATDAPLGRADELAAAVSGEALRAVVAARVEQIVRHGHAAEGDAMLPLGYLTGEALRRLQAGRDVIVHGDRQNLAVGRRRLAAVAALCLAEIDRIDIALARKEGI